MQLLCADKFVRRLGLKYPELSDIVVHGQNVSKADQKELNSLESVSAVFIMAHISSYEQVYLPELFSGAQAACN